MVSRDEVSLQCLSFPAQVHIWERQGIWTLFFLWSKQLICISREATISLLLGLSPPTILCLSTELPTWGVWHISSQEHMKELTICSGQHRPKARGRSRLLYLSGVRFWLHGFLDEKINSISSWVIPSLHASRSLCLCNVYRQRCIFSTTSLSLTCWRTANVVECYWELDFLMKGNVSTSSSEVLLRDNV